MAAPAQPPGEQTCEYEMSDGLCCRPIHPAPEAVDKEPVCLMHSHDPDKGWDAFWAEIKAILEGKSKHICLPDVFDFRGYVFTQDAYFRGAKFTKYADFCGATFTHGADFIQATFSQNADFSRARFSQKADFSLATFAQDADFAGTTFAQDADFREATFTKNANFSVATFSEYANFVGATFARDAYFSLATFTGNTNFMEATFTQDAYFIGATFTRNAYFIGTNLVGAFGLESARILKDAEVFFQRVSKTDYVEVPDSEAEVEPGETPPKKKVKVGGLRVRLRNTLLERIRFEDVQWHPRGGRLVLQDERDLEVPQEQRLLTHELVADAYRRLVLNFEKARQYEWAEQAVVGEMEMRRRNSDTPLLTRLFLLLYRTLSIYGSSFARALVVLGLMLFLVFPFFLSLSGLRMRDASDNAAKCAAAAPKTLPYGDIAWRCALAHHEPIREMWETYKAGVLATFEIATLQRDRRLVPAYGGGRALAIIIVIALPGQVALFLLALRRRFRR